MELTVTYPSNYPKYLDFNFGCMLTSRQLLQPRFPFLPLLFLPRAEGRGPSAFGTGYACLASLDGSSERQVINHSTHYSVAYAMQSLLVVVPHITWIAERCF